MMMRRFEMMMATATTRIRLACMRASNESSSMPPPFRAASPHPPLNAFTLHLPRDLLAAWYFGPSTKLAIPPSAPALLRFLFMCCFICIYLYLYISSLKGAAPEKDVRILSSFRLTNPRYRDYVFEDFGTRSMCHCKDNNSINLTKL